MADCGPTVQGCTQALTARREDRREPNPSRYRVLGVAIFASASGILPAFLVGALATEMRVELGFSEFGLGAAVSAFFLTAGFAAISLGGLVARWGWERSIRIAAIGSLGTLIGIPIVVRSWLALLVATAFGGIWYALAMPASNLALARGVWQDRQGLSFGVRQAAVPATMIFSGLALPFVALTVGWRWAFVVGTVFPAVSLALVPTGSCERPRVEAPARRSETDSRQMLILSVAGGLAAAAGTALAAFLVTSVVDAGLEIGTAGHVLAGASAVGLAVRVVAGWTADHLDMDGFSVVAGLLLLGSLGYVILTSGAVLAIVVGAMIAFGGGWGWPGAYHFGVVQSNPVDPARATGVAQAGLSTGAAIGPFIFGFAVERFSFAIGWMGAAALSLLSAGLVMRYLRA